MNKNKDNTNINNKNKKGIIFLSIFFSIIILTSIIFLAKRKFNRGDEEDIEIEVEKTNTVDDIKVEVKKIGFDSKNENNINHYEKKIEKLNIEIESLNTRILEIEDQQFNSNAEKNLTITQLETDLDNLKKIKENLDIALAKATANNTTFYIILFLIIICILVFMYYYFYKKMTKIQQQKQILTTYNQVQKNVLKENNLELNKALTQNERNSRGLIKQNLELETQNQILRRNNQLNNKILVQKQEKMAKLQNQNIDLRNDFNKSLSERVKIMNRSELFEKRNKELNKQIQTLTKNNLELDTQNKTLKTDKTSLNQELGKKQNQKKIFMAKNNQNIEKMAKLQTQNSKLRNSISKFRIDDKVKDLQELNKLLIQVDQKYNQQYLKTNQKLKKAQVNLQNLKKKNNTSNIKAEDEDTSNSDGLFSVIKNEATKVVNSFINPVNKDDKQTEANRNLSSMQEGYGLKKKNV